MRQDSGEVSPTWIGQVPPHLYFIGSALFHYLGPSFAVLLFSRVAVAGVAWLRIVSAGLIFAVWRRPWRTLPSMSREAARTVAALGIVLGVMNYAFYMAIARLPLGTVAAIEFVGPIALALRGARSWRNVGALALAVTGVGLLTDARFSGSAGAFAWAALNALLFAAYIVLAHRVAWADPRTPSIDRLALAMLVACVVITPLGLGAAAPALTDAANLAAGVGVGVSSSVVPYVFDQLAMRRLARATYALFIAILPATAALVGAVVLGQIPTWVEGVAIALVAGGVLVHRAPLTPERRSANSTGGHLEAREWST